MKKEKPIRVLEMIDDASIGGGQTHVLMLLKYLDQDAFDVSVACEGQGFLVDEIQKIDKKVIPVSMDNHVRLRTFRAVKQIFDKERFDIVHTHGGTAGFWGRFSSLFTSRPPARIHTYHGLHYLNEDSMMPRRFPTIDILLLRFTHRVICVCKSDYVKGLRAGVVSAEKGVIVHHGIELERFQDRSRREKLRSENDVDHGTIVYGNVGRLHRQKGQEYLLKAFRIVKQSHQKNILWIIGDGGLRDNLEQAARELQIQDAVRFLGDRMDIPDLLSAIDIFVLPSLWEGQPISLLEAMASGKPVIASSVDGISDILMHEGNGLLVLPKDVDSLAQAMIRLNKDKSLFSRLSSQAAETVAEQYSARKMAEQIGQLYIDVYTKRFTEDYSGYGQ